MPKKLLRSGGDAPRSVVNDPRFSSMHSAPIFKKIQKDSNKITVDERFQTVLTDDRFRAVPGSIDIYGRKTKKSSKSAAEKELNSFYQVDDNIGPEEDEVDASASSSSIVAISNQKCKKGKGQSEALKVEDPETRLDYLNRLARGDVTGSSSEESEDEDQSDADTDHSDDEGVIADDFREKGPLDLSSDEEEGGEEAHATCRVALMNCDWDSLKAQDLMAVLQSFCPTGETIDRVTVYPSDFGKEKMANEATHGPPKIWIGGDDNSDFEEADEDSDDENNEDEGYEGIEAVEQIEVPVSVKKGEKWKRANGKKAAESEIAAPVKEKMSKSDRKGDFKRLPGTVGIVLQDDLVLRGKNRGDDADEEDAEGENSEEDEGRNYFNTDLSKGSNAKSGEKMKKGKLPVKGKDKRNTLERERFTGAGKGDVDGEGGFDEVALRAYELSKLKYYFAVAKLSSVEAAESLMAQLDGVELGHSSMVFDLRFVPEDTSFEGRDVRDQCSEVGLDYSPPDFVVNALQHTTVQCSWDEGEKDRERKLTNISQWRQLQESELLQYVASSDSDDEDDDEDEGENSDDSDADVTGSSAKSSGKASATGQRKQSAANLRRLLLGGGSDDDFSEDSDDDRHSKAKPKGKKTKEQAYEEEEEEAGRTDDAGFEDDFFMEDGEGAEAAAVTTKVPLKAKKGNKAEESDMTFTYVPDAKKQQQDKRKEKERDIDETPFETMQRRLAEKRKARKAAKKLVKSGSVQEADSGAEEEAVLTKVGKKEKSRHDDTERGAATTAELELLLSDDDEDYDMRALHKQEMDALKGPKGKRKSRSKKPKEPEDAALLKDSTGAGGGDFTLDLQDTRFARLLEGDSSFGIDRTSSEFKETKAMKQIFGEQRSRREKEDAKGGKKEAKEAAEEAPSQVGNVDSLVTKLKRKYAEQSSSKPKQARL